MPLSWMVYTVVRKGPEVFDIIKARWTQDGPGEATVARSLTGVTEEDAAKRCADMQAGYDRIRTETQP